MSRLVMVVGIFGLVSTFVAATGCAATETAGGSESPQFVAADRAPAGSTEPAPVAEDRGTLVRTVAAPSETTRETGVTTWKMYTRGPVTTIYGFDEEGKVRSEVGIARSASRGELKIHAPGAGTLHARFDGTIIANDLVPSKVPGLTRMGRDFAKERIEVPYGYCNDDAFTNAIWDSFADCGWDYGYYPQSCVPKPPFCGPPGPPPYCGVVCPLGTTIDPDTCGCVDPYARDWWAF